MASRETEIVNINISLGKCVKINTQIRTVVFLSRHHFPFAAAILRQVSLRSIQFRLSHTPSSPPFVRENDIASEVTSLTCALQGNGLNEEVGGLTESAVQDGAQVRLNYN